MAAPEPIVIADYDPRWPRLFELERARLEDATRPYLLAVEHIGSTAVPGLAAKPTIDLLAGLFRLDDALLCVPRVTARGYAYFPEFEKEFPERRYFSRGPESGVKYHVHMVEVGTAFWERHLAFRNWLRARPEDARAYGALKRELAASYGADRSGYTEAKTEFIRAVEQKSRVARAARPPPLNQGSAAGGAPPPSGSGEPPPPTRPP